MRAPFTKSYGRPYLENFLGMCVKGWGFGISIFGYGPVPNLTGPGQGTSLHMGYMQSKRPTSHPASKSIDRTEIRPMGRAQKLYAAKSYTHGFIPRTLGPELFLVDIQVISGHFGKPGVAFFVQLNDSSKALFCMCFIT